MKRRWSDIDTFEDLEQLPEDLEELPEDLEQLLELPELGEELPPLPPPPRWDP